MDIGELVDDLAVYLDLGGAFDQDRAALIVALTLERVGNIVSPVPDAARPIVLDVAARGYSNPQGTTTETAGPFTRTVPMPGVYLTKRERGDLRALVGRGGAFTVNPIVGLNEETP